MRKVALQNAVDFAGFRASARCLLQEGVAPEDIHWEQACGTRSLFADPDSDASPSSARFTVPAAFLRLAETVVLHSDPDRFALLYRLLWRLRNERRLLEVSMDADVARAHLMAKAIHRDIHKMHAFVRFRQVPGVEPRAFIAWFEPQHHIVEAASPFFVRRFANTPWAIVTPERRASWNLHELSFGPGGSRSEVPSEDAAEDLWRSYYASIFNPARLKVNSMRAHMPQKYWRNLPESPLIPELIARSRQRTETMIDTSVTDPARRHQRVAESRAPASTPSAEKLSLQERAQSCRACPLWQPATQIVFGEGPADARIVLVGEQPGDQEDIQGRPFVGPAGQLLDRALADAGLRRESLYVTNAVKHFKFEPRGKRRLHKTPGQLEVLSCRPWLEEELNAIRPDLVVALGATAARSIFGKPVPILKHRGQIVAPTSLNRPPVLLTIHPAALLRMPDSERPSAYGEFVGDLRSALPFSG